ncbi:hypothetical protein LSAT2_015649, partial [Lamellibrachia satsuma]
SAEKARCIYCNTEFGIGHGGRSDVKRHMEREAHTNAVAAAKKAGRHRGQMLHTRKRRRKPRGASLSQNITCHLRCRIVSVNWSLSCLRTALSPANSLAVGRRPQRW